MTRDRLHPLHIGCIYFISAYMRWVFVAADGLTWTRCGSDWQSCPVLLSQTRAQHEYAHRSLADRRRLHGPRCHSL